VLTAAVARRYYLEDASKVEIAEEYGLSPRGDPLAIARRPNPAGWRYPTWAPMTTPRSAA
jgi:hypothetical protein